MALAHLPGRLISALLTLLLVYSIAPATSQAKDEFVEITAPETKHIMETEEGNAMVVNVLSSLEYELQHIPGSINIPINKIASTSKLPRDKTRPLIFYCMGPR
ncbi:MAG: rhodanese-like domain-containing protein [Thermodesulfobacteriota bacterium]